MNYYNEFDHKAAAWLRELIRAGEIPAGDVDERSIVDVQPGDLARYTQCHFFAGIGGWSLALKLAGWPADKPVWTGSCPCQPFSSAGKQLGTADERHLWPAMFRLIRECRPVTVFGEQVATAIGKGWLDGVSADLESEGYACGAAVLGAHSVGAPHIRQRLYWVANAASARPAGTGEGKGNNSNGARQDAQRGQCISESSAGCADSAMAIPEDQGRQGVEPECQAGISQRSRTGCCSTNGRLVITDSQRSTPGLSGSLAGNERYAGVADHAGHPEHVATPPPICQPSGWRSPSSRDWKDAPGMSTTGINPDGSQRTRLDQLPRQATLVSGPGASSSPAQTEKRAALNPSHSRWLMGFPAAWDSCGATAMQSSRKSRQRSSKQLTNP